MRRLAWFTAGWTAAAACLLVMSAVAATPPRSRRSYDSQVPLRYQRVDLRVVPQPGGGRQFRTGGGGGGVWYGQGGGSGSLH